MSIKLETLDVNATLTSLETAIQQSEAIGFELITFASSVVNGQSANTIVLLRRQPGASPGPLRLQHIADNAVLAQQESDLNAGQDGGKRLISYGTVFVQGQPMNIAAYRG